METNTQLITQSGLCPNCTAHQFCLFEIAASAPIHQCESYELKAMDKIERIIKTAAPNIATANTILGLCGNCELKETCNLRTPEMVIFSCEEYK